MDVAAGDPSSMEYDSHPELEDEDDPQPDESMDGDHASALASAGWGTDEDYEHNSIDELYADMERDFEPFEPSEE